MESCVIYARFSSHGQNEQSIEAQVRICKEFAESKGLKTVNIYNDKARTGTNDSRPGFQKMIADAQSGAFKYIIVYMFDRFARNRRDSIMYKEMLKEKYGVRVLSALEPIAEDEGGEFYEMFLDWNAEKYSKRLSKRVKDGLDTSVANGTYCGGTLIYGYKIEHIPIPSKPNKFEKKVVINEEEAEILRFAFEEYSKGTPKKEIAEKLNNKGCRLRGKLFTSKSFDKYLRNQKYTGEFIFGGRICNNTYPQIIDKETFEIVGKRLDQNRYVAGGQATSREPYLLTGKLFCGHCGAEMNSDGGTGKLGKQHHYYACKKRKIHKCDKKREIKDSLELYVTNCVKDYLNNSKHLDIIINDVLKYYENRTNEINLKSIKTKIANANKEVQELADAFVKAKSALLQQTIETKMQEYEILLDNLYVEQTKLELERGYKITKEDLLYFVEELLNGDINDKEYQQKLIDNLVYQVYVSDNHTLVYFNIGNEKAPKNLTFEMIEKSKTDTLSVQTQSPLSRQEQSHSNSNVGVRFFYFCIKGVAGFVVPTSKKFNILKLILETEKN